MNEWDRWMENYSMKNFFLKKLSNELQALEKSLEFISHIQQKERELTVFSQTTMII